MKTKVTMLVLFNQVASVENYIKISMEKCVVLTVLILNTIRKVNNLPKTRYGQEYLGAVDCAPKGQFYIIRCIL